MRSVRLLSLFVACFAAFISVTPVASAKRLKLQGVAGLPPNATRDVANGPGGEMWMTSDQTGHFVARISGKGKLLKVVPVPGRPDSITRGPDGAMWFTLRDTGVVGRVTRDGALSYFPVPLPPGSEPRRIVTGPDKALWLTLFGASAVGRVTTAGAWTIFRAGLTPGAQQLGLTSGPGGLWLTEPRADRVVKLTTAGAARGFLVSNVSGPEDITVGFDGNLWFTEDDGDRVGKVTPGGKVTEFASGITPGGNPFNITSGPDDAMWFTEAIGDRIARVTPDGRITEYDVPHGSVPRGIVLGPERKLWVSFAGTGKIMRFTPPLAPLVPADFNWSATSDNGTVTFSQLRVEGVPAGGRIVVLCKGSGCPQHRFSRKARRFDLRKRFRHVGVHARLQVRMMATGYSAKVRVFKFTKNGIEAKNRCIPPRTKKLRKRCG